MFDDLTELEDSWGELLKKGATNGVVCAIGMALVSVAVGPSRIFILAGGGFVLGFFYGVVFKRYWWQRRGDK